MRKKYYIPKRKVHHLTKLTYRFKLSLSDISGNTLDISFCDFLDKNEIDNILFHLFALHNHTGKASIVSFMLNLRRLQPISAYCLKVAKIQHEYKKLVNQYDKFKGIICYS